MNYNVYFLQQLLHKIVIKLRLFEVKKKLVYKYTKYLYFAMLYLKNNHFEDKILIKTFQL